MNLTLAIDDQTAERARVVAQQQGKSLNAMVREYLEQLAGQPTYAEVLARLQALWGEGKGRSATGHFRRADAYQGKRFG